MRGDINTAIAGPVALGSVLGAVAGARILTGISGDKLRIFFVIVLVLLAIAMGMSSFGFRFKI
ncbi:permease [Brucella neotomae]|nr:sulfite exporter TauE/SafE family protein [Brucella neotomae 5K33]SPU66676.1 permease [Brucella neotomae]SPU68059.1 permease [Brucella neotomae]SUW61073.1 permease [Brucella neotomae]